MHDILFWIPVPFTAHKMPIHSYGAMAMLGFLAAMFVARWRARRAGLSADNVTDVAIWGLLGGIVGSRVVYVAQNWGYYFDTTRPGWSLFELIKIWEGGLVFYGGLIGAVIAIGIVVRLRRERLAAVADVLAPSVALGHAFGRVGCFLRGCCYGVPVKEGAWYGVVFPPDSPPYDPSGPCRISPGTPVFPSQVVSALDLLIIFAVLSVFFGRRRHEGEVTALYLILYPLERFIVEFYRGDTHLPGTLSSAQWISLFMFFFGLGLMAYLRGNGKELKKAGS